MTKKINLTETLHNHSHLGRTSSERLQDSSSKIVVWLRALHQRSFVIQHSDGPFLEV